MSATADQSGATAIRPFHVDVPDDTLEDLRRRIVAARLPSKELVDDRPQGVKLATIQALARWSCSRPRSAPRSDRSAKGRRAILMSTAT
jgi:hypothetical protein